ncbi:MAG: hypothetical protein KAU07_00310 [Candidatus Andersenbacteria bacterium]|nr:hypothetical protein [Candidatus Andersenbacteria bacterium]
MPEINNENINLQEIEEMEKKLAEKKAALGFEAESSGIETKEAEITKENVQEHPLPTVPSSAQTQTTVAAKEDKKNLKKDVEELRNLDTAGQVKKLAVLAFEKGISHSIKVARSLNDAYLLDELHDKLIGELHQELVEKGKLKDI